ncbi:MAG: carbamoyltransferase, partial [Bacteroidota bacterium]|nr:carbamoyltransferase [Bacteroidota bacterium]
MIILGLNSYHADSSAAIIVDGKLLAATEEERFTRIKHWAGFPSQAVLFCLKEAGITLEQVDHIAIGRDPKAKLVNKMMYLLKNPFGGMATVINRVRNAKQVTSLENELSKITGLEASAIKPKIHQVEHHRSHLASAFFASPFEESALLSIDGSGDFSTTMIGIGRGNKIEVIDSVDFPVSVGTFYTAFTQFLGFPHYGDEYKVMGLAPYGQPKYVDKLRDIIQFT